MSTRLQIARKAALARAGQSRPQRANVTRPAVVGARVGGDGTVSFGGWRGWLAGPRLWLAMGVLVLAASGIGLTGIGSDPDADAAGAELDLAILADELPVSAYIDNGFDAWLKRPVEQSQ